MERLQALGLLTAGLLISPLSGCRPPVWRHIPHGRVLTPGVEFRAEDGSFLLRPGARFRTPFYTRDCVAWADRNNWKLALRWGARRVRVTYPGIPALCEVHPTKAGPAGRSFDIKVPPKVIAMTATGQTVVVVKETAYGRQFRDGFQYFDAWQLWLSRYPFPR